MTSPSPYTVSDIDTARDVLGIRERVKVDWLPQIKSATAAFSSVNARYETFDPFHFGHIITVSWHGASLKDVNAWLWHELTHAAQVEEAGNWHFFKREYDRQRRDFEYMDAPYEKWAWHVQRQAEAGKVPSIVRARRPKCLILSDGSARVDLDAR